MDSGFDVDYQETEPIIYSMSEKNELLEIVDKEGKVIGIAERSKLHADPSLIHRVVHVLVFNEKAELLLQRRSMNKDVAPGKWDTSVGGHVNPGEDIITAAKREMKEELGIRVQRLEFLYTYLFRNHRESELVSTFSCTYDGSFDFNKEEIDEIKFWGLKKIKDNIVKKIFSRHFEKEIESYFGKSVRNSTAKANKNGKKRGRRPLSQMVVKKVIDAYEAAPDSSAINIGQLLDMSPASVSRIRLAYRKGLYDRDGFRYEKSLVDV